MDTIGDGSILIEDILSSAEIGAAKQRAKFNAICMHRDAVECAVLSGALEHELSIRANGRDCELCLRMDDDEALEVVSDVIEWVMEKHELSIRSAGREFNRDNFIKLVQIQFADMQRGIIA